MRKFIPEEEEEGARGEEGKRTKMESKQTSCMSYFFVFNLTTTQHQCLLRLGIGYMIIYYFILCTCVYLKWFLKFLSKTSLP